MLGYRIVKGHILTLLGLVRQRPAMYVYVAERDCRVQLSHVQALIAGYVLVASWLTSTTSANRRVR